MPDRTEANPNELNQDDARYGFRCCHLKNIWTAPLPPETELSRQMTTSTTSIDIMGLQAAYANLHTDQERDYFMQRYHDRSEERFSRNAETDLVCRLLLEKKKKCNRSINFQHIHNVSYVVTVLYDELSHDHTLR